MKLGLNHKSFVVAATAGAIAAMLAIVPDAEARTYTKEKWINKDKCYMVKKVPALIEYDTRGKLVRDESRVWVGNFHKHGAKVRDKHKAAVYIQTSRVVEDQHYTLVPASC